MDEYGTMQLTKEDAGFIKLLLITHKSVVFSLSEDRIGAMIVLLSREFIIAGNIQMPFGGNPVGRIYVGIYGKGCSHLSMEPVHPDYISEKLNLNGADAGTFSRFWRLMWEAE